MTTPATTRKIVSEATRLLDDLATETLASQMLLGTKTPTEVLQALVEYAHRHPSQPTATESEQVEAPE